MTEMARLVSSHFSNQTYVLSLCSHNQATIVLMFLITKAPRISWSFPILSKYLVFISKYENWSGLSGFSAESEMNQKGH